MLGDVMLCFSGVRYLCHRCWYLQRTSRIRARVHGLAPRAPSQTLAPKPGSPLSSVNTAHVCSPGESLAALQECGTAALCKLWDGPLTSAACRVLPKRALLQRPHIHLSFQCRVMRPACSVRAPPDFTPDCSAWFMFWAQTGLSNISVLTVLRCLSLANWLFSTSALGILPCLSLADCFRLGVLKCNPGDCFD